MRWVVQRELGSSVVFFHQVTIPPGTVEGTHRHIGTEELYYIVEGKGIAYMGDGDDPTMTDNTQYHCARSIFSASPNTMCAKSRCSQAA